jgi:hypothetical protein
MSLLLALAMVDFLTKSWVPLCTLSARTVTISWWIVLRSLPPNISFEADGYAAAQLQR